MDRSMISGCPFCHHQNFRIYRNNQLQRGGNYRDIVICNECGLLYPGSRMDLNESHEWLHNLPTNKDGFSFGEPTGVSRRRMKYYRFVTRWAKSGGNALDIGAFDGSFCHTLGLMGFRVYGLEPQIEAVKYARKQGIDIYQGSFPFDMPNELNHIRFVLISLMEVLYYLQDLRYSLKIIYRLLTDDGFVLIKCHQGYSRYYDKNSFFSRYGDSVQGIPSLSSLKYCLRKTGFKIIKVMGECSPELWPPILKLASVPMLRRVVTKLYQLFLLNYTLLDIQRADRLIILAKKV